MHDKFKEMLIQAVKEKLLFKSILERRPKGKTGKVYIRGMEK